MGSGVCVCGGVAHREGGGWGWQVNHFTWVCDFEDTVKNHSDSERGNPLL